MNVYVGNASENPAIIQMEKRIVRTGDNTPGAAISEINDIITLTDTGSVSAKGLLRNLMAGDTFTAIVAGLDGDKITLALANGAQVTATLMSETSLDIGQNLTFVINENTSSKISIKPLLMNEQEMMVITKALDASNLQLNPKNIQIVKELLNQNMPIRSDMLQMLSRQQTRFPETDLTVLIRLTKLGIPVNNENIKQFEAYNSFKNSIATDLSQMGNRIGDLFANTASEQGTEKSLRLSHSFLDILYPKLEKGTSYTTAEQGGNQTAAFSMKATAEPAHSDNLTKIPDLSQKEGYLSQSIKQNLIQVLEPLLSSDHAHDVLQKLGASEMPAREFLVAMNQLLESEQIGSKDLQKLFQSRQFRDAMHWIIRDSMKISPEDVREAEHVKEYYTRIHEMISQMSEHMLNSDKAGEFGRHLENVKNNIEFMNELNKNMSYFQLPVKLSSSDAETELYVFTNKKKLLHSKETVSALLHLNMDHLGNMDVFVKLAGKNLKADFYLENESILSFLDENIGKFVEKMEKLGYQVNAGLQVKEKEEAPIDFIKDFIDYDNSTKMMGQFLFDTKA